MTTARAQLLPDRELIQAIKGGDEQAFAALVDALSPGLMRMAQMYVRDRAVAEEVVQETWLAVLRGIDRFEGRSSLKTWIYRILMNTAKTRGQRESRSIPFLGGGARRRAGGRPGSLHGSRQRGRRGPWAMGPGEWPTPEEALLSGETRQVILQAIEELPRRASARSSRCATWRACPPTRSPTRWAWRRATSACCSTVGARRCAQRLESYFEAGGMSGST